MVIDLINVDIFHFSLPSAAAYRSERVNSFKESRAVTMITIYHKLNTMHYTSLLHNYTSLLHNELMCTVYMILNLNFLQKYTDYYFLGSFL